MVRVPVGDVHRREVLARGLARFGKLRLGPGELPVDNDGVPLSTVGHSCPSHVAKEPEPVSLSETEVLEPTWCERAPDGRSPTLFGSVSDTRLEGALGAMRIR